MTAEGGYQAYEPAESDRPVPAARVARSSFETALLRQALADEDSFWDALEDKEGELQRVLQNPSPGVSSEERQAAAEDLESLAWLEKNWGEVQHNARCVRDFQQWLRTPPGRAKLFARYCRHAIPSEWDRLLREGAPPFIFGVCQKLQAHLEHCQLCGMQRQLAEGRVRRAALGRLAWGDQLVLDFLTTFCGEVLAAVCDPRPEAMAQNDESPLWSDSPPWRLALVPGARLIPRGELHWELPARLEGPATAARLAVRVVVQHIAAATREAGAPVAVLPARGRDAWIEWQPTRDGTRDFPLLLPAPAEPGRLLVRYSVTVASPDKSTLLPGGAPTSLVSAFAFDVGHLG